MQLRTIALIHNEVRVITAVRAQVVKAEEEHAI